MKYKTKRIVLTALFIAIMACLTMVISIPIASFGYINLSDMLIYLISSTSMLSFSIAVSGIGCMLADIFLGYSQYAIITLFAKGLEAFTSFYLVNKKRWNIYISYMFAGMVMLCTYAIGDCILTGDLKTFTVSFLANLPQAVVCIVLAILSYKHFKKIMEKIDYGSK